MPGEIADVGDGGLEPRAGFDLLLVGGRHIFSAPADVPDDDLPEHMSPGDLALVTVATHKASRLISKDRVTSAMRAPFTRYQHDDGPGEVSEAARGHGLRRAVGELLVCPYCIGMWISAGFAAGLLVAPRFTRWFAAVLVALFGADVLQIAYRKAEDAL